MLTVRLIIAALVAASPASASSKSAVPVTTASNDLERRTALAARVVDMANPDDRLLAQEMRAWEAGIRLVLKNDQAIVKLEQHHPGLMEAAVAAARPIAESYLRSGIGKMKRYKVERTASALTITELEELHAFYRTPAGRRLAEGLTAPERADFVVKRVAEKLEGDGPAKLTEQDAAAATDTAVQTVMGQATPEDIVAIMRFEATPVGQKLKTVGEEVQRYTIELSVAPDPAFLKKQQEAVIGAILAFTSAAKR